MYAEQSWWNEDKVVWMTGPPPDEATRVKIFDTIPFDEFLEEDEDSVA